MTTPQPFMGLPDLGDIAAPIIDQIAKALPPAVGDAIKNTVDGILGDGPVNVGDPQPPGEPPIPVKPGTKPFAAAVKVLDTAIGALDALMKLAFIIPDQYEVGIKALRGALSTVRGWLD